MFLVGKRWGKQQSQARVSTGHVGASAETRLKEGEIKMATKQIIVQRFSVTSSKSFQDVTSRLEAAVGHPDISTFRRDVSSAKTFPEVEKIVNKAIGPSGFMEFARFDQGEFLSKARGAGAPRSLRLVVGNPLIMKQMVEQVPDAGSYAPVTILIDERPDGVHLSYDTMASFLTSYGSQEAMKVAQDLDSKVEALIASAAG
ncbi:MAG: hypothetical protein JWR26_4727 [Pedosphaera sp.]|nr:hypothetical protein [Pedosphaera sp.]